MKRIGLVLLLPLIFLSCNKSEQQSGETGTTVTVADTNQGSSWESYNSIWNLKTYKLTDKATNTFKKSSVSLGYGEAITVYSEIISNASIAGGTSNDMEFQRIDTTTDTDIWVPTNNIFPQAKLGMISSDDTVLYTKPAMSEPSSRIIPFGTLVSIDSSTAPIKDGTKTFIKVLGWDEVSATKGFFSGYLDEKTVSTEKNDIESLKMLFKANHTTNETVKTELLEGALTFNSSVLKGQIQTALNELKNKTDDTAPVSGNDRSSEPFAAFGSINDDNVNVRSTPDETLDNVISVTSNGTSITITERTKSQFTIGGDTDYWYKADELNGWVFGTFVTIE
ncbi:SH3 domain-containing protein [Spirochaeta cellobiosiphila]|uniref:SH3 domain-containing protein n=1 Tax=Spirochaeta cellobiosiphila TaxID=504483 RepID=UPI00040DECFB|nr:SH3 domain-containing protein [Spirochaeta cellobiosiphila]